MLHRIEILACCSMFQNVEATQIHKLLNTEWGNMGHRPLPPTRSYRISQVASLDHFLAALLCTGTSSYLQSRMPLSLWRFWATSPCF